MTEAIKTVTIEETEPLKFDSSVDWLKAGKGSSLSPNAKALLGLIEYAYTYNRPEQLSYGHSATYSGISVNAAVDAWHELQEAQWLRFEDGDLLLVGVDGVGPDESRSTSW